MRARAHADTASMPWSPSPSGTVHRKRVHLVGPPESGQVTSIVRYEPGARFPAHDHPDGEEILVLDGVFSDEHGDWPAGTYLLNPEGFRHAPFSKQGCLLFVKLRQYAGLDRVHVALQTEEIPWEASERDGVEQRALYPVPGDPGHGESMRLERWRPGTGAETVVHPDGLELLVLRGVLEDETGAHGEGSWLRLPPGASWCASSVAGCELYVKAGAVTSLRSLG